MRRDSHSQTGRWRAILNGESAAAARKAVHAVCSDITKFHLDGAERSAEPASLNLISDHALLLAYAGAALDEPRYRDVSEELLDQAVERLQHEAAPPWLYGGFTGLALTVAEAEGLAEFGPTPEDDASSEIDVALIEMLTDVGWQGEYDLISGLCGIGAYLATRLPSPDARQGLERVVDWFAGEAEVSDLGTTWHTPVERLPLWQREVAPDGYYNLGVAHGIPGVMVLLAQAVAGNVAVPKSRRLLDGVVSWLLAQRQPAEIGSRFAAWIFPGQGPKPSRLAWCYGDIGVATALLAAARLTGRRDWEDEAITLLIECAARPAAEAGVHDAGLCHGSAGLAHLFNRTYQATGLEILRRAASEWFEHALTMRQGDFAYGGFWAYEPFRLDEAGETVVAEDPIKPDSSFLTGAAGVALALLAGTSALEPNWDRRLMVAVPLRRSTEDVAPAA